MVCIFHLFETGRPYLPYIIAGGTVALTGYAVHRILSAGRPKFGEGSIKAPPDTVLIYQFKRGPYAPSMSPYPLKLETYCRLAKIPYMVDTTGRMSSRNKIPWMTYNGEIVEDSEMCIDYLNKKLGVDLNSHLTKEQRAVAKMIQVLVDEHLYWPAVLYRWVYHHESFHTELGRIFGFPKFVFGLFKKRILNMAKGQGIGRHTKEEVYEITMQDFRCLSDYLGDKRYMLGDKICHADCAVFGLLCQYMYNHFESPGMKNIVEGNFPNLHQYILRIKEEVWPDWVEQLKEPVYT